MDCSAAFGPPKAPVAQRVALASKALPAAAAHKQAVHDEYQEVVVGLLRCAPRRRLGLSKLQGQFSHKTGFDLSASSIQQLTGKKCAKLSKWLEAIQGVARKGDDLVLVEDVVRDADDGGTS